MDSPEDVDIVGAITDIEIIAIGSKIDDLPRLQREYGRGRWRKLKGIAYVRLDDGAVVLAEVHWYELHGLGRVDTKVKNYLEE